MTADASGVLVLFSGGQDSTVCLAWALDRYQRVETVGFEGRGGRVERGVFRRVSPRMAAVPGSEFTTEVDLVVVAIGQSPNPLIPQTTPGLKVGKWGTIDVDWETMATSLPGVYSGGDIARGGATVILAMGDARTAAAAMDRRLRKDPAGKAAT